MTNPDFIIGDGSEGATTVGSQQNSIGSIIPITVGFINGEARNLFILQPDKSDRP